MEDLPEQIRVIINIKYFLVAAKHLIIVHTMTDDPDYHRRHW